MKRAESVVRVPRYSVLKDLEGGHFVFNAVGNEFSKVAVALGIADDLVVRAPDIGQTP